MPLSYLLSVWLHIIAAAVWIGGMAFLALVVVPTLRQPAYRDSALELISQSGKRFRVVGWICLSLLLLTGMYNLALRGFGWTDVWNGALFQGGFGFTLSLKLCLVTAILVLSMVHDFLIGPRATVVGQSAPASPQAKRLRRQASWMGRLNVLLALVAVALGVLLVRA